jgi:hypothetical protein
MFLASSLESNSGWVFRIFDRRAISVKAKNEEVRKIAVVDLLTGLPFGIDVLPGVSLVEVAVGETYYMRIKVYTSRNLHGVAPEHIDFFEVLDVDQTFEDFIKAYWLYPKLIKFELVEVGEES